MILIPLLSLFAIVESQTQDQSLYVRLGSVFESICLSQVDRSNFVSRQAPPGKVGPVGAKGEAGINGSKGEPGEPDNDKVEKMIAQRIHEVLNSEKTKYSNLSTMLSDAYDKIGKMENETSWLSQQAENGSDHCPMKYNGKCFWIIYRDSPKINFPQGSELCASQGGKPANIYSEDHFYMMMGYLTIFTRKLGYVHVWIGMTYISQTKMASLTNGSRAPFIRWHAGYPTNCCNMGLKAVTDWQSKNQYFYVHPSSSRFEGVICEN